MKRWTLALAAILIPVLSTLARACPLCKDSIPNNDAQSAAMVPNAVNNSIYFMFAGFACMLGLIVWTLVHGARSWNPSQPRGFPVDKSDTK